MNKDPDKKELNAQQHQKLEASIPITHNDLRALYEFLNRQEAPQCEHTLHETNLFLEQQGLDVERIIAWFQDQGGLCDCEVIFNLENKFGEIVRH